jgi:GntR family transcriptional regulator
VRISIDVNDPLPVFAQLICQIRGGVQCGELKPGAALPPIRQLAADLQINPNTVAKAYSLLERDGVIDARGRRGCFVHRDGRKHSKVDLASKATVALSQSIAGLRALGLTDSEIRIAFTQVMRERLA